MDEQPLSPGIGLVEVSGLSLRALGTTGDTVVARALRDVLADTPDTGEVVAAFANEGDDGGPW
ncbi:FxSxx-COOH cyclophane-containing RiPP peptide [Nocardiopsis protaetiae]|uniref:FxSxx-COOH cyclophane-containing RiPP peptide n=1 Tax=Nocardiopsis protaetiae TaxID=3382270 RepID=UPI00387B3B96